MFPSWSKIIKTILATITVMMTVYTVLLVGPLAEARFFPVLDKLHITEAKSIELERVEVRVWANKLRACEYVGLSWYRKNLDGTFNRAPLMLTRTADMVPQSPTRPLGPQNMGPWYIGMTITDLYQNSFAEVTHRCHVFWPTISVVYP